MQVWQQPLCPALDPHTHQQESEGEDKDEEDSGCDQQAGHLGHHTETGSHLGLTELNLCQELEYMLSTVSRILASNKLLLLIAFINVGERGGE